MTPWLERFGVPGPDGFFLPSSRESLVVSILSAGTFFGALLGAPAADHIGRKWVCARPGLLLVKILR
jgi:MFS family permease